MFEVKKNPAILDDADLENVTGGVTILKPAVPDTDSDNTPQSPLDDAEPAEASGGMLRPQGSGRWWCVNCLRWCPESSQVCPICGHAK